MGWRRTEGRWGQSREEEKLKDGGRGEEEENKEEDGSKVKEGWGKKENKGERGEEIQGKDGKEERGRGVELGKWGRRWRRADGGEGGELGGGDTEEVEMEESWK